MRKEKNKGFSLIELIIVLAIMAALVAILAPQYIKYVASSRKVACETNLERFFSSYLVESVFNPELQLEQELALYQGDDPANPTHRLCPAGGKISGMREGRLLGCSVHGFV